jgi:hypothetical protein
VSAARAALCDYLNEAVPLADLWRQFAAADERFAEVAARIGGGGARVLRQDPVECVFQFLCSSNNNIKRIEKMVWTLASYGERPGEVGGFVFHRFPTIKRLARVSEQEFRDAGFGYRSALGAFLRVASCICVLCYKHQLLCLFYSALLVKFSLVSSISKLVWVEDQRLSCSVANSSLL